MVCIWSGALLPATQMAVERMGGNAIESEERKSVAFCVRVLVPDRGRVGMIVGACAWLWNACVGVQVRVRVRVRARVRVRVRVHVVLLVILVKIQHLIFNQPFCITLANTFCISNVPVGHARLCALRCHRTLRYGLWCLAPSH